MSSTSALDIIIKARDEASSTIRGVEEQSSHMGTTMSHSTTVAGEGAKKMGDSFKGAFKAIGAAIGIVGIEQFATKSLEAFDEVEKAEQRMGFALNKIGAGKPQLDGIVEWAKQFSLQSGVAEGSVLDLTSKLAAMGQGALKALGPDGAEMTIENLSQGLQDMSAATGKSTSMLMRSLAPAIINTPAKAVPLLQKLGALTGARIGEAQALSATDNQTIRDLIKSGAVTKEYGKSVMGMTAAQRAQNLTTFEGASIQKQFAGAAAKTATPMEKLKNYFNQLEIGAGSLISGALGWLLNTGWPSFVSWIQNLMREFKPFIDVFKQAAMQVLPALQDAWNQLLPALQQFWQAIKPLAIALGVLIALVLLGALKALPYLIKAFVALEIVMLKVEGFVAKVLVKAFTMIWHAALITWAHLKVFIASFMAGFNILKAGVMTLVRVYVGAWRSIYNVIHSALSSAWNFITGIWNKIVGFVAGIGSRLAHAGATMWNWLVDGLRGAVNSVVGLLNSAIAAINRFQIHVHVDPPGPGSINFDWNGPGIPSIPTLREGGVVMRTGMALVHEGEVFSGVGRKLGGSMNIVLDRRRFVASDDYDVKFRGF